MRTALCLSLLLLLPSVALGADSPLREDLRYEMDRLVESPGGSRSVAAGMLNPAVWTAIGRQGLYLAYEDGESAADFNEWRAVAGLHHLGLGITRQQRDDLRGEPVDQWGYTLGLSVGNRHHALGLAYGWTAGGASVFGARERLTLGHVLRWRPLSLGWSRSWEFENDDALWQADLGLRPLGPRWTLFADMLLESDLDDADFGYGLQAHVLPGLTLAARARDTGDFSLRVDVGLGRVHRPSYRHHVDRDGDRVSSSYAVEFTRGPHLQQAFPRRVSMRELDLEGRLPYRRYRLLDDGPRFYATLRHLENIALDPTASGVRLNLSGMRIPPAILWELRAQLQGLRDAGKVVHVYFDRLDLYGFLLASVADELWMDPHGDLDLKGVTFGRSYYARMLEKIGVGFDEWRYFTYKSAAESFSRQDMSAADQEQLGDMLQDWYAELRDRICTSRGIHPGELERAMDEYGELRAEEALGLGLVDTVGDWHRMREEASEAPVDRGVAPSLALEGLGGHPVWAREEWGEPDRIALLYAIGPCSMDGGIAGRRLSRLIRAVREDRRVKAVVLRADSPGGDPLPSDLVARELKLTAQQKPVLVSQGQVAGSGGYWISMHGDEILASPFTITGSIGVIAGHVWDDGLGEKLGVDYDKVQIGAHADMGRGARPLFGGPMLPDRPVTEAERERAEEVIRDLYATFLGEVAEGRDMTPEEVDAIGQGRVWSGTAGRRIGLVDEVGGLWQTLQRARAAAGIEKGRALEIVEGPRLGWLDPDLLGRDLFGLRLPWARTIPSPIETPSLLPATPPFDGLGPLERDYLEQVLRTPGAPLLMMEPLRLDGDTPLTP